MFLKISFCLKYLFIQYTDGDKNRVLHKKSFLCNTQSLTDFSRAPHRDIFSKIGMGNVRGITNPSHAYNSAYQGSHYSAFLIGCVKYCSRLY